MANIYYPENTGSNRTIYNFFTLYDLPQYYPDNPKYGGFLPLSIYTTSAMSDTSVNTVMDDDKVNKGFILPLAVGPISDSVSVTYSNKTNKLVHKVLGSAVSTMFDSFGKMVNGTIIDSGGTIAEEAAKYFISSYDAGSLNKRLDVEFILPIMSRKTYKSDFTKKLYTYLGALQGMVYPSNYGFARPPAVRVDIGGMYKGFKAFIESISLRTSDDLIDVNGEMVPLVYYGSIKFINVWNYMWNTDFVGSFNLSTNPAILFGHNHDISQGSDEARYIYGSIDGYDSVSVGKSANDINNIATAAKLKDKVSDAEKELQDKAKNKLREERLAREAANWKNFEINNTTLSTWSSTTASKIKDGSFLGDIQNLTGIYNAIKSKDILSTIKKVGDFVGNGSLYGTGLDGFSPIYNAYKLVERALDVGSVDAYMYTAGVLINSGVLQDVLDLGNVTKATNTGFTALTSTIGKIFDMGSELVSSTGKMLDFNDTAWYYSNPNNISAKLASTTNSNEKASVLYNGMMANAMIAQNSTSLSNSMMNSINAIIGGDGGDAISDPLTMFAVGSTYGIGNSLSSGLGQYKESFTSMYNAAEELYADNTLSSYEYNMFKRIYDESNKMDLTYMSEINPTIVDKATNVANALEEAGI